MRDMRKLSILLTGLLLALLVFALPALAAPAHKAAFTVGQKAYTVDGRQEQMDAAAFIENGRTYVPVRYLALALGVAEKDIMWDGKTATVTLKLGNTTVKLVIGSQTIHINDKIKQMDVSPLIRNGRTYLPARWVAEAFGYVVDWKPESRAVLVYPPGQEPPVVEPVQPEPVQGKIDMTAARNGTLKPPVGAVAPPDMWGFPAKAVRMEFKVGDRYAKVTRPDGSTYQLDLGTPCVVVTAKEDVDWLKSNYPLVYKPGTYVIVDDPKKEYWAFYVPFIPVAEAFGVPKENIVWDGKHLAVFGFDGSTKGYIVLRAGSKETIWRWVTTTDEVIYNSSELDYPLFVKDGVPMLGINSVDDVSFILFIGPDVALPAMIDAYNGPEGGWPYETGVVVVDCEPRV